MTKSLRVDCTIKTSNPACLLQLAETLDECKDRSRSQLAKEALSRIQYKDILLVEWSGSFNFPRGAIINEQLVSFAVYEQYSNYLLNTAGTLIGEFVHFRTDDGEQIHNYMFVFVPHQSLSAA